MEGGGDVEVEMKVEGNGHSAGGPADAEARGQASQAPGAIVVVGGTEITGEGLEDGHDEMKDDGVHDDDDDDDEEYEDAADEKITNAGGEEVDDLTIAAASLEGLPAAAAEPMALRPLAAALVAPPHMKIVLDYHAKDSGDSSSDDIDTSDDDKPPPPRQVKPADGAVSDDEEEATGGANHPRTKNEVDPPLLSKPTRPALEGVISKLGTVSAVLDGTVVVQAQPGTPALDEDTELCFEDRACLGAVAEIFGPIYEPLYILRFESQSDIDPRAVVGAPIFFASEAAKKVDQAACLVKGSDASNIHDEEPGEDEVEYSDDEAEQAAKAKIKERKRNAAGQRASNSNDPDDGEAAMGGAKAGSGTPKRGRGDAGGRGRGRGKQTSAEGLRITEQFQKNAQIPAGMPSMGIPPQRPPIGFPTHPGGFPPHPGGFPPPHFAGYPPPHFGGPPYGGYGVPSMGFGRGGAPQGFGMYPTPQHMGGPPPMGGFPPHPHGFNPGGPGQWGMRGGAPPPGGGFFPGGPPPPGGGRGRGA